MPVSMLIFALSALALMYIIAGYPALLALRKDGPPVRKEFVPRTVTMLIAVHNGERFLEQKLKSILNLDYPRELVDVVVISDGSTDRTEEIAESFAHERVRLLRGSRGGKALALNAGIKVATGEIVVFTDVRQELGRDSLRHLISCYADPSVGVASAEISIRAGERQEESEIGLYRRYDVWMRKRMSEIGSAFGASGGYYSMRRELVEPIPADTLLDDVAFPMRALYRGYRVILEPRAKAYDYPTALNSEFQRRVRTLGGLWQVYARDLRLWTPRNPMWLDFASQKLGRLMMPYALLGMTLSVLWFPDPWRTPAVLAMAGFYGLGLVDLIVPQGVLIKKFTSPVRSFLVMTAASLCALVVFVVPPQSLWKSTVVNQPVSDARGNQ